MLGPRAQNVVAGLALLVLPALAGTEALTLARARGPFHLSSNLDPEHVYLLNGLNLLYRRSPGYASQPGTPFQVYCAAVTGLRYGARGEGRMADDVLLNPGDYLETIRLSLIGVYAAVLLLGGLLTFRLTGSLGGAVLAQSAPFLSLTIPAEAARLRPETFLLPLLVIFSYLLLKWCWAPPPRRAWLYGAAWGALTGVLIATKFPLGFTSWASRLPRDLEGSLARLRRTTIDLYQVHYPAGRSIPRMMKLMAEAVKAGDRGK